MIVFAPFAATQLLPWPAIPSTRRGGPASRRIATGAGGFASCNRSHCRRPSSRTNPCEVGVRLDGAVLHGYAPLRCHWLELRPAGSSRARKLAPVGCFCGACQRHGVRKSRLARRQPPVRAGGRVRCAPRAFAGVHAGKFLRGLQRARVRWRREARELPRAGSKRRHATRPRRIPTPPGGQVARRSPLEPSARPGAGRCQLPSPERSGEPVGPFVSRRRPVEVAWDSHRDDALVVCRDGATAPNEAGSDRRLACAFEVAVAS